MYCQVKLIAGKLRHFFTGWYQITSDSIIFEVIKNSLMTDFLRGIKNEKSHIMEKKSKL